MDNETVVAKMIVWLVGAIFTVSLIILIKAVTSWAAEKAIGAQQHQMSRGAFSRQLWSKKRR